MTTRRRAVGVCEYDDNNNIIIAITQYIIITHALQCVCIIYRVLLYISVSVRDRILRRPLCSPIVIKEISVAFFSWVMRDRRSHYNNLGGCGGHFFFTFPNSARVITSSSLLCCVIVVVVYRLFFFHSSSMRRIQYNNVIKYERSAHIIYFITLL